MFNNECTFETDILKFKDKFVCNRYAQAFYASLCNQEWVNVRQAPENYIEVLKRKNATWEQKRDAWYRSIPLKIIGTLRRIFIRMGNYTEKGNDGVTYLKTRKIPGWFNIKLLNLESKFWVAFESVPWVYSCSWRYAGGLVAEIRDQGEDYMDFYCSGNEGEVDECVAEDLASLGWIPLEDSNG